MPFFKPRKPIFSMKKKDLPKDVWKKCPHCHAPLYRKSLEENLYVCPKCGHHMPIGAQKRLELTVDSGAFEEMFSEIKSSDPLNFKGPKTYKDKLKEAQDATGLDEAVVCGVGKIDNKKVCIAVTDSRFIMGSMGSALGERITRLIEHADNEKLPLIIVSGSGGGARMYEGMFSLMQMAKTSGAIGKYQKNGGLFISVLTYPTMGGVLASFASIGDILIAEPGALIGFAGPRVIKRTIRQDLPEGFQRSEFLLEHGLIDMIVRRSEMKKTLSNLLSMLWYDRRQRKET